VTSPYHRLRARIDELPIPFPESETGAEIRLLKALFSEEEAEVAVHLSAVPEPVERIYPRVAELVPEPEILERMLEGLCRRGAINVSLQKHRGKRVSCYGLAPLVVGMFEFQVNRLTPQFVEDFHEYSDHGFRESVVGTKTAQMRTVPVGEAISANRAVGSYDDIRGYIEASAGPFAVMNCVCRQSAGLIGEACTTSSTHETCLTIGDGAAATVAAGISRRIERSEVLKILQRAEREGHVLQPQNSQAPSFICCCCRDCCEVLRNARKLPRPSEALPTTHRAAVDEERCIACGLCIERCPMEAIALDPKAGVDGDRCIGCGLCVSRCPTGAISLVRREDAVAPPKTTDAMYLRMFRDRFGLLGLLKAGVRRLLGKKI
jgi:ferredoxin